MAVHEVLPSSTSDAERPPGITCEDYVRGDGKRCCHYVAGGGCALPGRGVCTEWLKHNRPTPPLDAARVETPAPSARDLVRALADNVAPPLTATSAAPVEIQAAGSDAAAATDVDTLPGFTSEDIASFRALGVEVRFHAAPFGEIWLVPAYTGQARHEITPEHAATLARVLALFPGAQLVGFEKKTTPQPERPERPEPRS